MNTITVKYNGDVMKTSCSAITVTYAPIVFSKTAMYVVSATAKTFTLDTSLIVFAPQNDF